MHPFSLLIKLQLQALLSVHFGEGLLLLVVNALLKLLPVTLKLSLLLLGRFNVALKSIDTVLELLHILSAIFDIFLLLKTDRSIELGLLEMRPVVAANGIKASVVRVMLEGAIDAVITAL